MLPSIVSVLRKFKHRVTNEPLTFEEQSELLPALLRLEAKPQLELVSDVVHLIGSHLFFYSHYVRVAIENNPWHLLQLQLFELYFEVSEPAKDFISDTLSILCPPEETDLFCFHYFLLKGSQSDATKGMNVVEQRGLKTSMPFLVHMTKNKLYLHERAGKLLDEMRAKSP